MANKIQPSFLKADKRLLGHWKSDKRRTFEDWKWKKGVTAGKKAKLKSLFGKLELTYTKTKVISKLRYKKYESERKYAVLAHDDESVAIILFGESKIKNRRKYNLCNLDLLKIFSSPKIEHIHFDKKHFWISLGNGRNREFFQKVKGKK